ncbi:enoyl-CoA hydratase/isomerase family protein [Alphaproteobacteria bacterium LSUCC0719]
MNTNLSQGTGPGLPSYTTLLAERAAPGVLLVTLNRPDVANAFNTAMAEELTALFEALNLDSGDVRVVVLTGAGDRAFCAGGDLKERHGMSDAAWFAQHRIYERMARAIIGMPLPLIAAVNGAAYGGGCELASACDFIYAADGARFAQTEVRLGIIPGAGGTQLLGRAVGERRAKELIMSGTAFSADEAAEWGLVNKVVPADDLLSVVLEVATVIAGNAPVAVGQAKQAIRTGMDMGLAAGLAFEIEAYNRTVTTADRREGVAAFNEKREPDFKGS